MSKRHYSYEMIQVSNHSTRQVDRSRRSENHGQEYRPEIFIQTDDYNLILTSSPERNLTVGPKKENANNEEKLRFFSVIDEICKLLPRDKFLTKTVASTLSPIQNLLLKEILIRMRKIYIIYLKLNLFLTFSNSFKIKLRFSLQKIGLSERIINITLLI